MALQVRLTLNKFHYKFLYSYYQLEPPAGLEPVITTLKGLRPNRLDDGGILWLLLLATTYRTSLVPATFIISYFC